MATDIDKDIISLCEEVTANCHRSDARYAGSFSLCGLLLRLRDLFKFEKGLPPWVEVEPPLILGWIEEREALWEGLLDEGLRPLTWQGKAVDPFETEIINRDLTARGLFYGAGYAAFLKPSFFLAEILRENAFGRFRVLYLGEELARDLYTVPALTRGSEIMVRRRSLASYLWEIIMHGGVTHRRAMTVAMQKYGLKPPDSGQPDEEWQSGFQDMLDQEMEPHVWHEYGEAMDDVFPSHLWRKIIGDNPHSRVELMARAIKDLLADTGEPGRLDFIIQNRRLASLGIFLAQQNGLAERLFPELNQVFTDLLQSKNWLPVEQARCKVRKRVIGMAEKMIALTEQASNRSAAWLNGQVEEILYQPLGL